MFILSKLRNTVYGRCGSLELLCNGQQRLFLVFLVNEQGAENQFSGMFNRKSRQSYICTLYNRSPFQFMNTLL